MSHFRELSCWVLVVLQYRGCTFELLAYGGVSACSVYGLLNACTHVYMYVWL
jgi:hypothetical protein